MYSNSHLIWLGPNIMCITIYLCYVSDIHSALMESRSIDMTSILIIIGYVIIGFIICLVCSVIFFFNYLKKKKHRIPSSPHYINAKQNSYTPIPIKDRPSRKQSQTSSNSIKNNLNINGSLKLSKCNEYESSTIKRNSHGLNNGFTKTDTSYYE